MKKPLPQPPPGKILLTVTAHAHTLTFLIATNQTVRQLIKQFVKEKAFIQPKFSFFCERTLFYVDPALTVQQNRLQNADTIRAF